MARVPYAPVRDVVPDLQSPITAQTPSVNIDMFGGAQARGMQAAGQGISRMGDDLAKQVLEAKALENEAMAREAVIEGSKRMMDEELAFGQLQGKAAVEGYQGFRQRVEAIRAEAVGQSNNPAVKRLVDSALSRSMLGAMNQGGTHAARQAQAWNKETQAGLSAEAARQGLAAGNDPARVLEMGGIMERNLRSSMDGSHPPEYINAQVSAQLGGYYRAAIEQAAVTDPAAAQRLFERVKPKLDFRSQEAIGTFLDGKVRDWTARNLAQEAAAAQRGGGTAAAPDARARQAFDYFVAQGFTREQSAAAVANIRHESNFNETSSHDGGIGVGILGWSGDRRKALEAKYGPKPTFDQQLEFMADEMRGKGDAGMAAWGRQGPAGAGPLAADLSSVGVRPRDVEGNRRARAATAEQYYAQFQNDAPQASIVPTRPMDKAQALDYVIRRTEGDPKLREAAIAHVSRLAHVEDAMFAADRDKLRHALADLEPALAAGAVEAVPAQVMADLDRLLPPDDAARVRQGLVIAEQAGVAMRALQFGTPAEVQAMREQLATGSLRGAGRTGAPTEGAEGTEGFRQREQVRARFEQAVAQRAAALKADPAAYAAREPSVAQALALTQRGGPEEQKAAWQDYVTRSLAVQSRLGVARPQILTDGQVAQITQQITGTGPETGNMVGILNGFAGQFGPRWPQAFGELVERGKLPAAYQVLASMTEPGQRVAADQLQRGLALVAEKGGWQALRAGQEAGTAKQIEDAITADLSDFRRATAHSTGGERLYEAVHSAAKILAYEHTRGGMSASSAATAAVQGVLREKYDITGTAVYPKGKGPEVLAATSAVAASLTPAMLAPSPETVGTLGMTQEARQAAWVTAAKRGDWVPNKDSTGLVLMAPLENGARIPVKMADGSPVEVRFDALPVLGRGARTGGDGRPAAPVQRGMMDMPTFDLQPPRMQ